MIRFVVDEFDTLPPIEVTDKFRLEWPLKRIQDAVAAIIKKRQIFYSVKKKELEIENADLRRKGVSFAERMSVMNKIHALEHLEAHCKEKIQKVGNLSQVEISAPRMHFIEKHGFEFYLEVFFV